MELCKYHHENLSLLREDDAPVVYAWAVVSQEDGEKTLLEAGLTPERVAHGRAYKEPKIVTHTNPLGETHQYKFMFEYREPGSNPTETLNELLRQLGVDHQIEELPRDYWLAKIKDFLGNVPGIPSIREVYLVGGLAKGKGASKDADLLLVVDGCKSVCPLAGIDANLDLFCFSKEELQQLKTDNFKITKNMELLYRR